MLCSGALHALLLVSNAWVADFDGPLCFLAIRHQHTDLAPPERKAAIDAARRGGGAVLVAMDSVLPGSAESPLLSVRCVLRKEVHEPLCCVLDSHHCFRCLIRCTSSSVLSCHVRHQGTLNGSRRCAAPQHIGQRHSTARRTTPAQGAHAHVWSASWRHTKSRRSERSKQSSPAATSMSSTPHASC